MLQPTCTITTVLQCSFYLVNHCNLFSDFSSLQAKSVPNHGVQTV